MMNAIEKMRRAMTAIAYGASTRSFNAIIESEREAFMGLQVVFATKVKQTDLHGILLDQMSVHCPLVSNAMGAQGLLFYSDDAYARTLAGETEIAIDYSISFDKNVCEAMRLIVAGKNVSQPENFRALLHLVMGRGEQSLNFDYFAYLAEEHTHFNVPGNTRPKDTLRALKLLDFVVPDSLYESPLLPRFNDDPAELARRIDDVMRNVIGSPLMTDIVAGQRGTYAMMLQAVLLSWQNDIGGVEKLQRLVQCSLHALGRFAKTEVYLGWKMFGGAGAIPAFFDPTSKAGAGIAQKVSGMAWDVAFLRNTERLAGARRAVGRRKAEFFVPLIASYDRRFKLLIQACPLSAIVTDPALGVTNSIFVDELAFQEALYAAGIDQKLGSVDAQLARLNSNLDSCAVEAHIARLEQQVHERCAGV